MKIEVLGSKSAWRAAAAVFAGAFLIYLKTAAPSIAPNDSGAVAGALAEFGILRPPGFPLYELAARLFLHLPVGDPAFCATMCSIFFCSTAAALLYLAARAATGNAEASLAAAAAYAAGSGLWPQAVLHGPHAAAIVLFAAAGLWLSSPKAGASFGSLWSILALALAAAAVHFVAFLALAPAAFLIALGVQDEKHDIGQGRRWMAALLTAALFSTLALLLPLRSAAGPLFDLTVGDGLAGVRFHLFRMTDIPDRFAQGLLPRESFGQLTAFLKSAFWSFNPIMAIIAVAGALRLASRGDEFPSRIFYLFAAPVAAALLFARSHSYAEALAFSQPYFLPAQFAIAILAALGWAGPFANWRKTLSRPKLATFALALSILLTFSIRFGVVDRSRDLTAINHGLNILKTLPNQAILASDDPNFLWPAFYLVKTLGLRDDVGLIDASGQMADPSMEDRFGGSLRDPTAAAELIRQLAMTLPGDRPVFFAERPAPAADGDALVSMRGPLYFMSSQEICQDIWKDLQPLKTEDERSADRDIDRIEADYRLRRAECRNFGGPARLAAAEMEKTIEKAWKSPRDMTELANYFLSRSQTKSALDEIQKTLKRYPAYADANLLAAQIWGQMGDAGRKQESLQNAIRMAPRLGSAHRDLAESLLDAGDHSMASFAAAKIRKSEREEWAGKLLESRLAIKIGDFAGAEKNLGEAVAAAPALWLSRLELAKLFIQTNRPQKAIETLKPLDGQAGTSAYLSFQIGLVYQKAGAYNDSVQNYSRALELRPGWKEPFSELLQLYTLFGQYDLASQAIDRFYVENPTKARQMKEWLDHFREIKGDFAEIQRLAKEGKIEEARLLEKELGEKWGADKRREKNKTLMPPNIGQDLLGTPFEGP